MKAPVTVIVAYDLLFYEKLPRLFPDSPAMRNLFAGNPQLVEVTRDKKVVWTFRDFKTFGNGLAATQLLGVKGKVTR